MDKQVIRGHVSIPFSIVRSGKADNTVSRGVDISAADQEAILKQLQDTYPELPEYDPDNMFLFRISDESVDDWMTVFKISGWDLSRRNTGKRFVTYGHPEIDDPDPDVIIGKGYETIYKNSLYSLYIPEQSTETYTNSKASSVVNKLRQGIITDASIWALAEDGHIGDARNGEDPEVFYFTRMSLISYGILMWGSNDNATLQQMRAASKILANDNNNINPVRQSILRAKSKLLLR
jgi:hypothetical protein